MTRLALLIAGLLLTSSSLTWAQGQNAHPTGQFTPGHALRANTTSGSPYSDAGGAAGSSTSGSGYLTEIGITAPGLPFCINDALISSPAGYHRLCLGHDTNGNAALTVDSLGGATSTGMSIIINGQTYTFPGPGNGNMVGPNSVIATGDLALFNTAGTLIDGGQAPLVNVMDARFGARCNGSASDSAAFVAAAASFGGHGGNIFVPATGASCVLTTGISLPRNVGIRGVGVNNWTATSDTVANTTAAGSWIECRDQVNNCITIANVGSSVKGVELIFPQPDPAPGWTPIIYPFGIAINGSSNFTQIEDVTITGASHCLTLEGPDSGVGNIYSYLKNINFNGCWNVGTKFYRVDNTLYMENLRYAPYWNLANANYPAVQAYYRTHSVGWDVQYLANAQGHGIEFWQNYRAIQGRNGTVNSGFGGVTFAANELQLTNVSFNEVCQAVSLPDGNGTWFSAVMTNVIAYGDTTSNCYSGKAMFDLASDATNVTMYAPRIGYVDKVANVGHGAGGNLRFIAGDVGQYAAVTPGTNAFGISANASFTLTGTPYRSIRPAAGAGKLIGPGVDATQGYEEPVQVGGCGSVGTPGQGCVTMESSQNGTTGGSFSVFLPDGSRSGYIGRSTTTAKELNVVSDTGDLNLTPGAGRIINLQAPFKPGTYTVATLPPCDATRQSSRATVTDQAAAPIYGTAPSGGGGLSVSVTCTNSVGWLLQ